VKVGDLVEIEYSQKLVSVLVVRQMTFQEYCEKHDELMLEYDSDYAWIEWDKNGPTFEVLHPNGKLSVIWKPEVR
jgi:chloramphenicol O-acetyltransferase